MQDYDHVGLPMKFTHTLAASYQPTFRSESVAGMFDVPITEKLSKTWEVDMPIEALDWSIGFIVGPSGSGKSTIAKAAFPDAKWFDGSRHENWDSNCLLDDFPKTKFSLNDEGVVEESRLETIEITTAMSQVGFSSPPSWLLPFGALSNGQKFRTEIARLVVSSKPNEVLLVDEFTSVVDRNVAKICSAAVQKMIRRSKKKLIAVSCHYDIAEWLEPDWIYHADTGEFKLTRGLLRRPPIELTLRRVHHSAWRIFKDHHYLDANVNKSAHCFVAFMGDEPVAFGGAIPFPHPTVKNMWRAHRTVCLPDYQGVGIGSALNDAIAQHFINQGKRYVGTASHPAMIAHRLHSPNWVMTRKPGRVPVNGKTGIFKSSAKRVTASFEFIGAKNDVT